MNRRVLLGVLAAVLLMAAWWFFLISPRNSRISEAQAQLEGAQQQEMTLRAQIVELQKIRDSEPGYRAAIAELEVLIPKLPVVDDFINQIYELSVSTGVKLLSLSPSPPVIVGGAELREISVATTIEGGFFEVLGFLFGLSDNERLVRVDGLSVASSQDELGATILTVSLDIRLFTLTDLLPAPVVPGAGNAGDGTSTTLPGSETTTAVPTTAPGGG
jgi:Tfp pilus assembly protein PilO